MKYRSRAKNTAVKDIDIANILDHKHWYCIDIGKHDIDPPPQYTYMSLPLFANKQLEYVCMYLKWKLGSKDSQLLSFNR